MNFAIRNPHKLQQRSSSKWTKKQQLIKENCRRYRTEIQICSSGFKCLSKLQSLHKWHSILDLDEACLFFCPAIILVFSWNPAGVGTFLYLVSRVVYPSQGTTHLLLLLHFLLRNIHTPQGTPGLSFRSFRVFRASRSRRCFPSRVWGRAPGRVLVPPSPEMQKVSDCSAYSASPTIIKNIKITWF